MTTGTLILHTLLFTLMILGDLLWWKLTDRPLSKLRGARVARIVLAGWVGWMVVYLLFAVIFPEWMRRSDSPIPTPLHSAVYLWHLFVLPLALILTLSEEAIGAAYKAGRRIFRAAPAPVANNDSENGLTRRQLLGAAALAVPPLVTVGLVSRSMKQLNTPPRVRRMEIALPRLPRELDGMTIAHVSDTHVGKFTGPGSLPALADQVNNLRADFVVVTGDLIDVSLSDLPPVIDMLNRLDPRNGMLVCEGNHDLFESRRRFESRTKAAGLPLLVDEAATLEFRRQPVQFLGLRWERGDDDRIAESFMPLRPLIRPDAFPILLAHHPHAFDTAAELGIPLTLSGHTHGGQLMLTDKIGAGPALFRYWSGLYRKKDSALVVSNGVGSWFPLRINAPAEIIHLTLRATA